LQGDAPEGDSRDSRLRFATAAGHGGEAGH
jgi:hypothetical protein